MELEAHITKPNEDVLEQELSTSGVDKNTIVKISLTMEESGIGFDVEQLRQKFMAVAHYVKPIYPKIIRHRVKRNKDQTVQLDPKSAVKLWLKSHKPKNPKKLFKVASNYIEAGL